MNTLIDSKVLDDALAALQRSITRLEAMKGHREAESSHMMKNYSPEWPINVHYDWQPAERATGTYPGCDAEATPTKVLFDGVDILHLYSMDPERWATLCDECMQHHIENEVGYDV